MAANRVRDWPFYRALGKRITALREERQFTQAEIAQRLGVTQQAMFAYELGDRRVPTSALPVLARVLGVTVEALLGLAPPPRLRMNPVSPAQRRHVDELRKLAKKDRLAVVRITSALARFDQ